MTPNACFNWDGREVGIDAAAFEFFYAFLRETPQFFNPGELPATERQYRLHALALTEGEQWAESHGVEFDWGIDELSPATGNPLWLCSAVMGSRVVGVFAGVECQPGDDPSDSDFGRAVHAWVAFQVLAGPQQSECAAAVLPMPQKRRARRQRQLCAA